MSRSRLSPGHKLVVGVLIVGGLLAAALPLLAWAAAHRADQLVAQAADAQPAQAVLLYREAQRLKPFDTTVAAKLAAAYVALDLPDKAVAVLDGSGGASKHLQEAQIWFDCGAISKAGQQIDAAIRVHATSAAWTLKSKIEMEQGSAGGAIQDAQQATRVDGSDQAAMAQLDLTLIAGGQGSAAEQLIGRLSDPKAAQQLLAANSDYLSLARLMYNTKLLNSSQRVLEKQSQLNNEGYLLLAQTKLALGNPQAAKTALLAGLQLDPSDLPLRQLLLSVETQLGDPDVNHQRDLIQQLQTGKV